MGRYLRVFARYTDVHGSEEKIVDAIPANRVLSRANRAPQFPADTANLSLNENSGPGAKVGAPVTATDPDNDTLKYALSGADASSFSIEPDSGQITANSFLDRSQRSSYSVTASAADEWGGSDTMDVTINVGGPDHAVSPVSNLGQLEVLPEEVQQPNSPLNYVALEWTLPGTYDPSVHLMAIQRRGVCETNWSASLDGAGYSLATTGDSVRALVAVPEPGAYDFRVSVNRKDGTTRSDWVVVRTMPPAGVTTGGLTGSITGGTGPTVSLSDPSLVPGTNGIYQVEATFSESMRELSVDHFVTDDIPEGLLVLHKVNNLQYRLYITPGRSGAINIEMPAGSVTAYCGGFNLASNRVVLNVNIDRPVATMIPITDPDVPGHVFKPFQIHIDFNTDVSPWKLYSEIEGKILHDGVPGFQVTNGVAIRLNYRQVGGPYDIGHQQRRKYVLDVVPTDDGVVNIKMEDWMFLKFGSRSRSQGNVRLLDLIGSAAAEVSVIADPFRAGIAVDEPVHWGFNQYTVVVHFSRPVEFDRTPGVHELWHSLVVNNGDSSTGYVHSADMNDAKDTVTYAVIRRDTAHGLVAEIPAGQFFIKGASRIENSWQDDEYQKGNLAVRQFTITEPGGAASPGGN